MKKLILVALSVFIATGLITNNTNLVNKTSVVNSNSSGLLEFTNINENRNLVATKIWNEINQSYKKSKPQTSFEMEFGPNTSLPDGSVDPLIYLNKASQLWSEFKQPSINKVYFFNFKDASWAQQKLRNLNGSWFKPEELSCSSPSVCAALGGSFGESGQLFIGIPVREKYHVNNFYNTLAHEYTHTVQYYQAIKTPRLNPYPLMPCWFAEGQPQVSGWSLAYPDLNSYLLHRKALLSIPAGVLGDYSSESIKNFFSKAGLSKNNKCDSVIRPRIYDTGYFAVEALSAIGGINSTMNLVGLISSGASFEDSFKRVYGISWSDASIILSEYISSIYLKEDIKTNLNDKTFYPTLAILDTALDTSIPAIRSQLIGEVCIMDWNTCANGSSFMEGSGSSGIIPDNCISNKNFSHGTQMVSAAIASNPNMKVLFVRIIGNTKSCARQNTGINTVPNALKWLYENKDKYNIKAISMSQGHHNLLRSTKYCPVTNVDYWVDWLSKSNIPVFFPTGNGRDYLRIDWPACIPSSIAVGGVEMENPIRVSFNSNYDKNLIDIFAPISARVLNPGGSEGSAYGTSVSVQIAAARWLSISTLKPSLTINQTLDLINKTGIPVTNSVNSNGIYLDIDKIINE